MIRITFHPSLNIDLPKLERLANKLQPLTCKPVAEVSGRSQLIVDTEQISGNFAYQTGMKDAVVCKDCNSLHFGFKGLFRCLCGKYLNKGI